MLNQFYVRNAKTTRNSPFTFQSDRFYEVLRKRIRDKTKNLRRGPSLKSKVFADFLLTMTILTSVAASRTGNYFFALTAGVLLSFTTICAHNFFHQRDHWRRYYFQLSCMSVKGWRVSHAMSHHMFPNTQHDLEVAMFEPWLQWLPKKKLLFWRYVSWVYSPIVYTLIFPSSILIRWVTTGNDGFPEFVPLLVPAAMMLGSGFWATEVFFSAVYWWIVILLIASFTFGLVGINAGHHHPEVFHDGDIVKSNERMDWGVYQILAVQDRLEVSDSILGLVSFGDHCLHHLFPTLDHSNLASLYPELRQTCQEYGLELRGCSLWEAIKGQFLQLSRVHKLDFSSKHQ
uniref:Cytochrome b5-related protein n=1 Tax=Lygus hesperus TaxID=30085 RepID=A0A146L542_LYGHE